MAREIFTGTQAECNTIIAKANAALGYPSGTSIDTPYAIDASADVYEVVIFTGTQKNALSTSEKTKVTTTRGFENEDKETAKKLAFIESHSEIPFKRLTRLDLRIPKGAVLVDNGGTIDVEAVVRPSDATEKTKFHWSIDSIHARLQSTTGSINRVQSLPKSSGQVINIKCNSTDGSRVFGSIQLTIQ
tara:strand:- start:474 stop:1037 length:564 start_codon:yes stop_codon:yes gene_type:complete